MFVFHTEQIIRIQQFVEKLCSPYWISITLIIAFIINIIDTNIFVHSGRKKSGRIHRFFTSGNIYGHLTFYQTLLYLFMHTHKDFGSICTRQANLFYDRLVRSIIVRNEKIDIVIRSNTAIKLQAFLREHKDYLIRLKRQQGMHDRFKRKTNH